MKLKNNLWLFLMLILSVSVFTSCSSEANTDSANKEKYATDHLSEGFRNAPENMLDADLYGGVMYFAGGTVQALNLKSGEISVVSEISASALEAVESGLYIYNNGTVWQLSYSGEVENQWDFSESADITALTLVGNNLIATSVPKDSKTVMYSLNIDTGDIKTVSVSFSRSINSISSVLPYDEKNVLLCCEYSASASCYTYYICDISSGKLTEVRDYVVNRAFVPADYDTGLDSLYFSCSGIGDPLQFFRCDNNKGKGDGDIISVKSVPLDVIIEQFRNLKNDSGRVWNTTQKRFFFTGDNFIIWFAANEAVYVCNVPDESESKTLTILRASADSNQNNGSSIASDDNDFRFLSQFTGSFEAETGYRVQTKTYPVSQFYDRLRLKMLAGESDYDIVCIGNYSYENLILSSILNYEIYEPLEKYDVISANFDKMISGVKEMMTSNGHIFGVPIEFGVQAFEFSDMYDRYKISIPETGWTLDDFWNMCNEINEKAPDDTHLISFSERTLYPLFTQTIQDGVNKGAIDKDVLENTFSNLISYYGSGVISNNSGEYLMTNSKLPAPTIASGSFGINNIVYPFSSVAGNAKLIPPMSESGSNGYAILTKFILMNPNAQNKEAAAEFIERLTDDENIFNTNIYRESYLRPELDKYYKKLMGVTIVGGMEAFERDGRADTSLEMIEERYTPSESDEAEMAVTVKNFTNISVYTINVGDIITKLKEIFQKIESDSITAKEASSELTQYAEYMYIE